MTDIVERCTAYLSDGGLFNPELAIHDMVRDLVIDCRDEIERLREALKEVSGYVARADWFNMTEETEAVVDKIFGEKE
jgi:hypothetical protein